MSKFREKIIGKIYLQYPASKNSTLMTTDIVQLNLVDNEYFNLVYEDSLSMIMDNFSNGMNKLMIREKIIG